MNVGYQVVVGLMSVCLFVFCDYTITRGRNSSKRRVTVVAAAVRAIGGPA